MAYKELPADATACPSCGDTWGYKASDLCYDIRLADWAGRSEETDEIKAIRICKTAVCMKCGYRFIRP